MYVYLCCSNCGKRRRLSDKRVQYTVNAIGFELVSRIEIKDKKTGRVFR